ncbi:hypothetical protein DPMN_066115 [Dreissena polymorpha]|uniref:Uncharacterized protein n=1 Tax=Dreissena polymorpha TaxID=45954 RepID=A0A9D4BSN7_DREPO|nr:hypothetical protein DPMN_066115 [Dreissena polymorpha]
MVWNIDLDDFGKNCRSSSRQYPLMSLMKEVLDGNTTQSTAVPTTLKPTTNVPTTQKPTTNVPTTTKPTTNAQGQ